MGFKLDTSEPLLDPPMALHVANSEKVAFPGHSHLLFHNKCI